jgi:hypothetical protein
MQATKPCGRKWPRRSGEERPAQNSCQKGEHDGWKGAQALSATRRGKVAPGTKLFVWWREL